MNPRIIRLLVTVSLTVPGLARAQYALNGGYPSNGFGYVQHQANGTIVVQGNSAVRIGYGDPALATPPIYGYGGYGSAYAQGAYGRGRCDDNNPVSIRYQQAQGHAYRNGYGYGNSQGRGRSGGYRNGYSRGYQDGVRQGQVQSQVGGTGYSYGQGVSGIYGNNVRQYQGGYLTNRVNGVGGYGGGHHARQVIRTPGGGLAYNGY